MARILGKLGVQRARSPQAYRALAKIARDGGVGMQTLRDALELRFDHIEKYAMFPDWMRLDETRWWSLATARQIAHMGDGLLAAGVVSSIDDFTRLFHSDGFAINSIQKLVETGVVFKFPTPPTPGNAKLVPLLNSAQVVERASDFRNCAASSLDDYISGQAFLYVWAGPPSVMVKIRRGHTSGWEMSEAAGAGNSNVPESILWEIERTLELDEVNRSYWRSRCLPTN